MKLTDLDPKWLKILSSDTYQFLGVPAAEAQGVQFDCPVCWRKNGNSGVGTHAVICWFHGVPPEMLPGPGRWTRAGTGYHDLTLDGAPGKSRSVLLSGGCHAHFFVTAGAVQMLP